MKQGRSVIDVVRADGPISVQVGPAEWFVRRGEHTSLSPAGGVVYWRRGAETTLEFTETLEQFCFAPRLDEVDVAWLLAAALGAQRPLGRTHLRGVGRVPAPGTGWFSADGVILRADIASLNALIRPVEASSAVDRLRELIRDLPEWDGPHPAMLADGGPGSRFILAQRPQIGRITVDDHTGEVTVDGQRAWSVETLMADLPPVWPMLWDRHLPAALAVVAAARAGVATVVTGHDLRRLLSAHPDELAALKPGRWTGELPLAFETRRPPYRRARHKARTAPSEQQHPGMWTWLTSEGAERVHAVDTAGQATWLRWTGDAAPWIGELLTAWADPGLAWLRETARRVDVRLVIPAWLPEILAALQAVPMSARARVQHGLISNGPLLNPPDDPPHPATDGRRRTRAAAAAWASGDTGARSLDRLAKGTLVDTRMLDGEQIRRVTEDPFTRTQHALALRRLCALDFWLEGLQ
ncbi:hypothetical protein [Nocardia pseudobrasiliensis]|uniref:Uncharacterized protein n=1 Tax=Nocardia pseudobrasiliensis TaxID=45979 RepID=A0A370I224_9NOCA|nr:hypothetical protein [Nocardia pseudobrasiliensis]RDI64797.1 hypothetical protein DFR76_107173 [Nocardia pseudobrasiliensis]